MSSTPNYYAIIEEIKQAVQIEGDYLKIKDSKTIITCFYKRDGKIAYKSFDADGTPKGNAFEYLGFGFDGERILLKSQTLSRYYKKMHRGINAEVKAAAEKAKQVGTSDILQFIDISGIYHRYSNPHNAWKNRDGKKARNFISYAKRSKILMADEAIQNQLRKHRKIIRETLNKAIAAQSHTCFRNRAR